MLNTKIQLTLYPTISSGKITVTKPQLIIHKTVSETIKLFS